MTTTAAPVGATLLDPVFLAGKLVTVFSNKMATSSSWSAWAVFSNVEPPTSLHAATRGAAAASVRSGALLPSSRSFNGGDPTSSAGDHGPPATETFVCHFPFPLPALLVVYWIARPVAGKNAVFLAVDFNFNHGLLAQT